MSEASHTRPADAALLREVAAYCTQLGAAEAETQCEVDLFNTFANRLRALAVEMEEREQQRDAFFTAFTALPCRICGGKRNWQTDGQLQAVCHDCAHRTRAREGR